MTEKSVEIISKGTTEILKTIQLRDTSNEHWVWHEANQWIKAQQEEVIPPYLSEDLVHDVILSEPTWIPWVTEEVPVRNDQTQRAYVLLFTHRLKTGQAVQQARFYLFTPQSDAESNIIDCH